ncbi:hypothetical protein ACEWY4_021168 [Coilia grayii]|uniref:Phospholipase A2 n=1 Tax=Coilia grayii TaxID=363190 RepID=A0ABD1J9Y8_9TELE
MSTIENVHYWNLSVTVLRAKIKNSFDYWSESDCYVILKLPTASAHSYRTKTVDNSNNPEWNETFHFRIQSNVKHVLEIQMYDEDTLARDDLCAILFYDISHIKVGQQLMKKFILNEKTGDELWLEFKLVESTEDTGIYVSNGVLVAAPFSILEVSASNIGTAIDNLILKLKGAFKEDSVLTQNRQNPLQYFINRDLETILSVEGEEDNNPVKLLAASLNPVKSEVKLPVGKNVINLEVKHEERPAHDMAVRLDFDIPLEEKSFLEKRKEVVGNAFQKLLGLSSPPEREKVPLVGVVCSGGGTRAMTGTFGSLKGLQTLGILDAVSYITGVSGSTWAMSTVYQDPDWSKKDISLFTEPIKNEMHSRYQRVFSTTQLRYYRHEMGQKEKNGFPVSFVDMWGLAIEHLIYGKKWESTLSDQKTALSEGKNPLPIYTAVNMKTKGKITDPEWCEFTPYEVGIPKYGASVPTEIFGSEYFLGRQINTLPEVRLPFLIGIWSSAFSVSFYDLWNHVSGRPASQPGEDEEESEDDNESSMLDTIIKPAADITDKVKGFFTNRPVSCQVYNFMRGLSLHWNYNQKSSFLADEEEHPDAFPNQLTPADCTLNLVDAGLSCNTAFTPVVRSHRRMDLLLCISYSWDSDQFMVLKITKKHCAAHDLPFPDIDFSKVEKKPLKEVYVFEDKKNPKAPIVVHFPMVNLTFREFKAPGVRREGLEELKQGDVDVTSDTSPYRTKNLSYNPNDFQKLMDLGYYNILNNKDTLLSALRRALERERVN